MGKITQAQWEEFIRHKTTPDAIATSEKFVALAKKNMYPHHLGSSRYVGMIPEWKRKIEETVSAGKPNPLEGYDERTQHWLLARSNLTDDGRLVYKKPEVAAVEEKIVQIAAQERLGLFKPDREKDKLTAALGNPEHTGRVRAVASQMSWKQGFPNESSSNKKRDRYKKTMEEAIEEKLNTMFENKFMQFVQNLNQGGQMDLLPIETRQQVTQNRPPQLLANVSSVASTAALGTWYPMDDITVDTPCRLHIPVGRVRNKTK